MTIIYETDDVLPPLHPGEVLREEFLVPLGLSAGAVARACGVPRTRIERIAEERIGVSTAAPSGSGSSSERPRISGSTCSDGSRSRR